MIGESGETTARPRTKRRDRVSRAELRAALLDNPDLVLDDAELSEAIIERAGRKLGGNVVNLQSAVVSRMRMRMREMEIEREELIDAAEMNLLSMNQVHDSLLHMLEAPTFREFIDIVSSRFSELLALDSARLCIETEDPQQAPIPGASTLAALRPNAVTSLFNGAPWGVSLRSSEPETAHLHLVEGIHSEALIRLDFGQGTRPGLLLFGAQDPDRFHEDQGGELLVFLGGAVSRVMRRWLDGAGLA